MHVEKNSCDFIVQIYLRMKIFQVASVVALVELHCVKLPEVLSKYFFLKENSKQRWILASNALVLSQN